MNDLSNIKEIRIYNYFNDEIMFTLRAGTGKLTKGDWFIYYESTDNIIISANVRRTNKGIWIRHYFLTVEHDDFISNRNLQFIEK